MSIDPCQARSRNEGAGRSQLLILTLVSSLATFQQVCVAGVQRRRLAKVVCGLLEVIPGGKDDPEIKMCVSVIRI